MAYDPGKPKFVARAATVNFAPPLRGCCLQKPPIFETALFSHNITRSDCIAGFGLLTARRVRDITSPLLWCPGSAENRHGAKLPENPANMVLSGQNGM